MEKVNLKSKLKCFLIYRLKCSKATSGWFGVGNLCKHLFYEHRSAVLIKLCTKWLNAIKPCNNYETGSSFGELDIDIPIRERDKVGNNVKWWSLLLHLEPLHNFGRHHVQLQLGKPPANAGPCAMAPR